MGRIVPLNASAQAVADANGNATLYIYAPSGCVGWTIKRMITSVSGAGATPQMLIDHNVYTNSVSESNRRDTSQSGARDVSETDIPLQNGEYLIGTYANAPVGSLCTLTVTGTVDTGR